MNKVAQNGDRTGDTRLWVADKKTGALPLRYPAHAVCCRKPLYVVMEHCAWFRSGLVFMWDRLGHTTVTPYIIITHKYSSNLRHGIIHPHMKLQLTNNDNWTAQGNYCITLQWILIIFGLSSQFPIAFLAFVHYELSILSYSTMHKWHIKRFASTWT